MSRRGFIHRALGTLAAAALAASAMPAWAGDFPDHPIRWLVPFSAGGGSDLATRIVAKHVSQTLGQPVVVENRPGAATIVAAQETARGARRLYGDDRGHEHAGSESVAVQATAL
ncbi:tripartite tricarboxylate transporter substrate-binding protein [Achromobacter xylosoxidans]